MPQIQIKDANGTVQTVAAVSNTGQAARVDSMPVALSNEDAAVLANMLTNTQLRAAPVDTEPAYAASGKTPVTGTFSAAGNSDTFTPIAGRAFNITCTGDGVVNITRQLPSSATYSVVIPDELRKSLPESIVMDADPEVGAIYRLECLSVTSTISYRISQ